MQSSRGQLCLLGRLACLSLSFALPLAALAQTTTPASRPAKVQEALNRGVIAAQEGNFLLAIRDFQDARTIAPDDPLIFLNLGLAESKIPGRELRAIAWFGAYLAANPNASKAAAVKEQIHVLDVTSNLNLSHLIETVQDAAAQTTGSDRQSNEFLLPSGEWCYYTPKTPAESAYVFSRQDANWKSGALAEIAKAQAAAGDIAGAQSTFASALKTADLIQDASWKSYAQANVAQAQTAVGDVSAAHGTLASSQKTADMIADRVHGEDEKSMVRGCIAKTQAAAGDIAGAQKTVSDIQDVDWKGFALAEIAKAQAAAGDMAGAQKTVSHMQVQYVGFRKVDWKGFALAEIAKVQAAAGDIAGAQKTSRNIHDMAHARDAQAGIAEAQAKATSTKRASVQPGVSDWLNKLDDVSKNSDCPLNSGPFLDLAGYQQSLPPSDDPSTRIDALSGEALTIVRAQSVIDQMLRQQAKK
jgi:tetratricopeptide (TPR) repeat protein